MAKVAIIGCGFVGMATAYPLVINGDVKELVLVDIAEKKTRAEVLDLEHAATRLGNGVKVTYGEYADCGDADIICIAAGRSIKPPETRKDLCADNFKVMQKIVEGLKAAGFKGTYVLGTNPLDVMVHVVLKLSGLPSNQVIGSGTSVDTARLHHIMGLNGIPVDKETCLVLGEHGNSMMIPWGLDKNLAKLSVDKKGEILKATRTAGLEIFMGKGLTNYGIGTCLYDIIRTILSGKETKDIVCYYDKAQDVCYGRPAIIGKGGIVREIPLELNKEDKEMLQKSIDEIKSCVAEIDGI